jgi:hypothetical protein
MNSNIGKTGQQQQHSLLFQSERFNDFNPNPDSNVVGSGIFYNSTRTQVKEMTPCGSKK